MDWFMSDPHFGHKNILKFEAAYRPYADVEEMNWAIIRNINELVMPTDKLYILGDIAFSSKHGMLDHINASKIVIVLGNHDYPNKIPGMIKPGVSVAGCIDYRGCILTHIPVHPCQKERFRANIHGHLHEHIVHNHHGQPDPFYYNAGMELHDMKPIAWSELEKKLPKQKLS